MQVESFEGALPPSVEGIFPNRDMYYQKSTLDAFYGENWFSIMISDRDKALLSIVPYTEIGSTGYFDVEPFHGYSGPLATTSDSTFLSDALQAYSKHCVDRRVVAELWRFHPMLRNDLLWASVAGVTTFNAKSIVVVPLTGSVEEQLLQCSPACRRRIRKGMADFTFTLNRDHGFVDAFAALFTHSMKRVGAEEKWNYDAAFFQDAVRNPEFVIAAMMRDHDNIEVACLAAFFPPFAHYVMVASTESKGPGASEALIHHLAREAHARGCRHLFLGGGVGAAPDDALLRFKRKFYDQPVDFHIGAVVHDKDIFAKIADSACRLDPGLRSRPFFLKHRLLSSEQQLQLSL